MAPHRKKDRNWSVGLSTGNGTFSSSTSMDGYLPLPNGTRNATMNSAYGVETRAEIDKLVQFNNLSEGKDAQSDIKYRMPVTFGASLRFDLSDDWAVETGVDLYPTFIRNTFGNRKKQLWLGRETALCGYSSESEPEYME